MGNVCKNGHLSRLQKAKLVQVLILLKMKALSFEESAIWEKNQKFSFCFWKHAYRVYGEFKRHLLKKKTREAVWKVFLLSRFLWKLWIVQLACFYQCIKLNAFLSCMQLGVSSYMSLFLSEGFTTQLIPPVSPPPLLFSRSKIFIQEKFRKNR